MISRRIAMKIFIVISWFYFIEFIFFVLLNQASFVWYIEYNPVSTLMGVCHACFGFSEEVR
jgi:hypothetical protein